MLKMLIYLCINNNPETWYTIIKSSTSSAWYIKLIMVHWSALKAFALLLPVTARLLLSAALYVEVLLNTLSNTHTSQWRQKGKAFGSQFEISDLVLTARPHMSTCSAATNSSLTLIDEQIIYTDVQYGFSVSVSVSLPHMSPFLVLIWKQNG